MVREGWNERLLQKNDLQPQYIYAQRTAGSGGFREVLRDSTSTSVSWLSGSSVRSVIRRTGDSQHYVTASGQSEESQLCDIRFCQMRRACSPRSPDRPWSGTQGRGLAPTYVSNALDTTFVKSVNQRAARSNFTHT